MQLRPGPGRRPDLSVSQVQYRRRADRYDLELLPFEPYRAQAIELLELEPGATVLDVGCGTGLSLAPLLQAVGARGHVIGVEPSSAMLAHARERVAANHWHNVVLLEAPAATAHLHGEADAALFLFTHDVLRDPASIDHILAHLKVGARVVAVGLQWAAPWMVATNAFVAAAALYSMSSMDGLDCPFDKLAAHLRDVRVQRAMMGGIYIASGRLGPAH